jgi:hypothetical protein
VERTAVWGPVVAMVFSIYIQMEKMGIVVIWPSRRPGSKTCQCEDSAQFIKLSSLSCIATLRSACLFPHWDPLFCLPTHPFSLLSLPQTLFLQVLPSSLALSHVVSDLDTWESSISYSWPRGSCSLAGEGGCQGLRARCQEVVWTIWKGQCTQPGPQWCVAGAPPWLVSSLQPTHSTSHPFQGT